MSDTYKIFNFNDVLSQFNDKVLLEFNNNKDKPHITNYLKEYPFPLRELVVPLTLILLSALQ